MTLAASQTAAAELFKKTDEETRKLLLKAGLAEPEVSSPTALQEFHQVSKAYKQSTADLRDLVLRRVTLQAKCDKAKEAYAQMLKEVSVVSQEIKAKEKEVAEAHEQIRSKTEVPLPTPLPRLADILRKAGVELTPEQEKAVEAELSSNPKSEEGKNPIRPQDIGDALSLSGFNNLSTRPGRRLSVDALSRPLPTIRRLRSKC